VTTRPATLTSVPPGEHAPAAQFDCMHPEQSQSEQLAASVTQCPGLGAPVSAPPTSMTHTWPAVHIAAPHATDDESEVGVGHCGDPLEPFEQAKSPVAQRTKTNRARKETSTRRTSKVQRAIAPIVNVRVRTRCGNRVARYNRDEPMTETHSKHGGARVRFPPPLVFVALMGVGAVIQRWVHALRIPLAPWPRAICGGVIAIAGVSLLFAARMWFTRTKQDPAPWKPSPELIVRGIYRRMRNPMYVGMTLFQIGLGITLDDGWIAAFAPIGLTIVHFVAVLPEERYLAEKFGESYLNYKSSVRRYL
jgi:protein-S-isoprenylcysteine O-methyltransferase Ste14